MVEVHGDTVARDGWYLGRITNADPLSIQYEWGTWRRRLNLTGLINLRNSVLEGGPALAKGEQVN